MEKMMILVSVSEPRTFKGTDGNDVKAIDLVLSDGVNSITTSAIDKKAQRIIDHPLNIGSMLNVDFTLYTNTVKNDKGEFVTQKVRLNDFGVIVSAS